jgi:hypothetical protein
MFWTVACWLRSGERRHGPSSTRQKVFELLRDKPLWSSGGKPVLVVSTSTL